MRTPIHSGLRRITVAALAGTVTLLCLGLAAQAETDKDRVVALRARQLATDGRCVEALVEIERARSAQPESAELALLDGQCRVATFAYTAAEAPLLDARRLDSGLLDVDLYLAVAYYHLERFEVAHREIRAANGHVTDAAMPQYELYLGLILLSRDEAREAGLALERARLANAAQVEPVASYYAGLAWQSLNERELAREAFERVLLADPNGSWGRRAETALAGHDLAERGWANVRAGLEYDTNVVLNGDSVPLPRGISDEDDGRGVWFLEGGAELFRTDNWSGGLIGNYSGSAHFDLSEFDTHYPTLAAWIDRAFGRRTLARFRYTAGHAWVDYDDFATTQTGVLSVYQNWGRPGNTELSATWEWNRYHFEIFPIPQADDPGGTCTSTPFCAPFGVDVGETQDRDGNGMRLALLHHYALRQVDGRFFDSTAVRGGYAYGRYWAEGSDWDSQSHELQLGFETELPFALHLDALGVFAFRPFDAPSTYATPPIVTGQTYAISSDDREDKVWLVSTILARPINELVSVEARYSYHRNISNTEVFDYKRHLVGGYVTLNF